MNYLETGLPHTDLYKKKSEFVPPRYKPLCSLGRRYLGLEPVSKTELNSVINRLCQPKKQPEPENQPRSTRGTRPTGSGTGRFNGRKRMTGNQITNMVDRLTKRKTEVKPSNTDNKKKEKKITKFHVQFKETTYSDDEAENEEDGNDAKDDGKVKSDRTNDVQKDTNEVSDSKRQSVDISVSKDAQDDVTRRESAAHLKMIEEKMLEFMKANEEKEKAERDRAYLASLERHDSGSLALANISGAGERKPKRTTEEAKYESLYYRGVKTEIARKFFNDNYKRPSVQMVKTNRSDSIKSAKTELISSPRRNSKIEDNQNRNTRFRFKST